MFQLEQNKTYHAEAVQLIINTQLDSPAAAQINQGGGGPAVFQRSLELIQRHVQL